MEIENETPILSCILWKFFKTLHSTQLFEIWTLSYHDNVTGHTLVTLGKGREVLELCSQELGPLAFLLACFSCCAHVLEGKSTWDAFWGVEIWQKRKWCGATSEEKVPTHGFLVKKAGVWRNLSKKGADSWIFSKKGSCVA